MAVGSLKSWVCPAAGHEVVARYDSYEYDYMFDDFIIFDRDVGHNINTNLELRDSISIRYHLEYS